MKDNNQAPPNQPINQPSTDNQSPSLQSFQPVTPKPTPQPAAPSPVSPQPPTVPTPTPAPQPKIQEEPLTTAPLKKKRNYLILFLLILFLLLITISGLSIAIAYEKISFGNLPFEEKIREVVLSLPFLKNFLSALEKSFEKVLQLF